jgi:hypothetical protein
MLRLFAPKGFPAIGGDNTAKYFVKLLGRRFASLYNLQ